MSTHHDCCESRVTNIHRMADIVRGYIIPPNGGYFSINEHVGPRTVENGFVVAGAIENGEHVESPSAAVCPSSPRPPSTPPSSPASTSRTTSSTPST